MFPYSSLFKMVFVEKLNLILINLHGSCLQQLWLIVLLCIWHINPGIVVIFSSACRRASPSSKVAFYQYALFCCLQNSVVPYRFSHH